MDNIMAHIFTLLLYHADNFFHLICMLFDHSPYKMMPCSDNHTYDNDIEPPKTARKSVEQLIVQRMMRSMSLTDKDDTMLEKSSGGLVYGHVSVMGRRREMQDAVTVAPPGWLAGEYDFFAVYDGHGGARVAEICRETLHGCLEKKIMEAREENNLDWEKVMMECFSGMCEKVEEQEESGHEEARMMGSTAVVVLVGKEEVVVANCGDSRAVMCRGGEAVPLSTDHKPDRPDEKERVEAAGGNIVNWNGWRVEGVLATSRSLGDHSLKPFVSSEPEVRVLRRTESDNFVIMATDGLWDVVCNNTACEIVKKCLNCSTRKGNAATRAAAALAELAIAKGSRDNISIVVLQLD